MSQCGYSAGLRDSLIRRAGESAGLNWPQTDEMLKFVSAAIAELSDNGETITPGILATHTLENVASATTYYTQTWKLWLDAEGYAYSTDSVTHIEMAAAEYSMSDIARNLLGDMGYSLAYQCAVLHDSSCEACNA